MDKKNTLLLTVIAVATLLVAIVGATFAYFTAQVGAGADVPIRVETSTADTTMFKVSNELSLQANQLNFGATKQEDTTLKSVHSLIDTQYAAVTYTANNNKKEGEYCYRVGLNVKTNNFIYSLKKTNGTEQQGDYYPELVLRIYKATEAGDYTDISSFTTSSKEWKEYGTSEDYNSIDVLKTATGISDDSPSEEVTIPYKTINTTVKRYCDDSIMDASDAEETSKCKTEEEAIKGYDITMLGFDAGSSQNQATTEFTDEDLSSLFAAKWILIPSDNQGNYEHKIKVDKVDAEHPTATQLTKNDYWRFDLIFVNYSDIDVNEAAGAEHENTAINQVGFGNQNDNTGKEFTATIRFEPLAECKN